MTSLKLSRDLYAQGFGYGEMARLVRVGSLVRVRRGAYGSETDGPLGKVAAHRRLVEATIRQSSPAAVVSHMSAAVLHDLPVWDDALDRVSLTRDRAGGGRQRRYVRVYGAPLPPEQVTLIDGTAVTTLSRTVLDLACALTPFRCVPIGDAALARGLDRSELEGLLAAAGPRHGIGSARRSVALLDGRSESFGESCSRVIFAEQDLPAPSPQFEIFDELGYLVARVDFGWEEYRTIGEFDGKQKYGSIPQPGRDAQDALFAEKRREDCLRELGWHVVRWVWADLFRPDDLARRIRRALEQGQRLR